MAVRNQAKAASAAPTTPALAAPSLSTPDLASGTLRLPGYRGPWTYCVSPAMLHCFLGEIVPRLAKATHDPGAFGNAPGPNRGEGAVAWHEARGYRRVPHDLAGLVAFGEPVAGGVSHYLSRWDGVDPTGRPTAYHSDRWARPVSIGHLTEWERDEEGWLGFLLAVREIVIPGGDLSPMQIRIATTPAISKVLRLLDRPQDHPRVRRLLRQHAAHLPREYAPEGLLPYYEPPEDGGDTE